MYALDDRREVTDFYKNVTGQWSSKILAPPSLLTSQNLKQSRLS